MKDEMKNNYCAVSGEVKTMPAFSHAVKNEMFFTFNLGIKRLSGQEDVLPVVINEKLLESTNITVGEGVSVYGEYRSANKLVDGKSRLVLSVFAKSIDHEPSVNPNYVELKGYICKDPVFRVTPFNREITDVLLAVNRDFGKSDYIPCILWGANAERSKDLRVGSPIKVGGRIQSREYNKFNNDTNTLETKVAYEVSVSNLYIE